MSNNRQRRTVERHKWPLLREKELVACLTAPPLNCSLSVPDLQKPSAEKVKQLLRVLIEFLMGVTMEDAEDRCVLVSGQDEYYSGLHDPGIGEMFFIKNVYKLMQAVGFKDFKCMGASSDLQRPTSARTISALSAIINFAKFREDRLTHYNQLTEESDALMDEKEALVAERAELADELAKLKAVRKAEAPRLAGVQAQCDELEDEIRRMNVAQAEMTDKAHGMKDELHALKEGAAQLRDEAARLAEHIQHLTQRVVESPEKMQAHIDELREAIAHEESLVESAESLSNCLYVRSEALSKIERDVAKSVELLHQASQDCERAKQHRKTAKKHQAALDATTRQIEELVDKKKHAEQMLAKCRAKMAKLGDTYKAKHADAENLLNAAVREHDNVQRVAATKLQRIDENQRVAADTMNSVDAIEREHRQEIEGLVRQHHQLTEQVHIYHRQILSLM
jgi:kinetochore protein Nuf2